MIPSRNRLRSAARIRAINATGKRASMATVRLRVLASDAGLSSARSESTVAIVANRSVGSAVDRNKAKRRLRAAIAPMLTKLKGGIDAVYAATPATSRVSFQNLVVDVAAVTVKAGALSHE
ncbi:MAG: ribonuclease P protein component [Actinomycetota bacterium]